MNSKCSYGGFLVKFLVSIVGGGYVGGFLFISKY